MLFLYISSHFILCQHISVELKFFGQLFIAYQKKDINLYVFFYYYYFVLVVMVSADETERERAKMKLQKTSVWCYKALRFAQFVAENGSNGSQDEDVRVQNSLHLVQDFAVFTM